MLSLVLEHQPQVSCFSDQMRAVIKCCVQEFITKRPLSPRSFAHHELNGGLVGTEGSSVRILRVRWFGYLLNNGLKHAASVAQKWFKKERARLILDAHWLDSNMYLPPANLGRALLHLILMDQHLFKKENSQPLRIYSPYITFCDSLFLSHSLLLTHPLTRTHTQSGATLMNWKYELFTLIVPPCVCSYGINTVLIGKNIHILYTNIA